MRFAVDGAVTDRVAEPWVLQLPRCGCLARLAIPAAGLRGNQSVYAAGSIPGLPLATKYPPGALVAEQGWPPGNFNPTNRLDPTGNGVVPTAQATCYTDLVVKVPSVGSYDFSKIETCVEASRGNMESDAICLQSQGHNTINPVLPPRCGALLLLLLYYRLFLFVPSLFLDPSGV